VPFAVATANDRHARFSEGLLFRVGLDFIADKRGDLAEVEAGEKDRHDDLGGTESANAATASRFDILTTLARIELNRTNGEPWVYVKMVDSDRVLAFNDPSDVGELKPMEAVYYPEVTSRLWAWWLAHAWRAGELATDALGSVDRWSLATAAVLTRALLEEVAALSYEARQLGHAWGEAKSLPETWTRPAQVRNLIPLPLLKAFRGSRLDGAPKVLKSVSVLTLTDRLAKDSGRPELRAHYNWLSEAAHPAFAAATTYSSNIAVHDTGAVHWAFYTRTPSLRAS
jgi:hypothetical protein